MKLNLDLPVTNLAGEAIEGSNLGKIFADVLARSSKGDSIKLMDWALKLFNGQEIEINSEDSLLFKNLVEQNEEITILVKAQILKLLK